MNWFWAATTIWIAGALIQWRICFRILINGSKKVVPSHHSVQQEWRFVHTGWDTVFGFGIIATFMSLFWPLLAPALIVGFVLGGNSEEAAARLYGKRKLKKMRAN